MKMCPKWTHLDGEKKMCPKEKIQRAMSVIGVMWIGILLIYTQEINPMIGFFTSFVLWKLTKYDCEKEKINNKKLLLFGAIVFLSGNYKIEEYLLSLIVVFTTFQVFGTLVKNVREENQRKQDLLSRIYVSMAIFYTLRMIFIFEVPDMLIPLHEVCVTTMEYLRMNQAIEWSIITILVVLNAVMLWKNKLKADIPLILGIMAGMFGLEDMTAIIFLSNALNIINRVKEFGDEKIYEHQDFVQQTRKIYKL